MATQVTMGGTCMCTFGVAPSTVTVLPTNKVMAPTPAGNIMDQKPLLNILPFGVCTSLANPTVASATAAALGVLTPMPCIPNTAAPWVPGSIKVLIGNMPALDLASKAMCMWGGVISVMVPGQFVMQDG